MPILELSKEELEILVDAMMFHRVNTQPDCVGGLEYIEAIGNIHLKLETALEFWVNGGVEELPVPEWMKKLAVVSIQKVHEPHGDFDDCDSTENYG